MKSAAPVPWRTRAAMSHRMSGAATHIAEAAVKTTSPAVNNRRAPRRSPRPPARSRKLANGNVYPSTTQERPAASVCKVARMLGRATLPAVTSSSAMPSPKLLAMRVSRGAGCGRRMGGSSGVDGMDALAAPAVASSAHGDHAILHGMADWDAGRFFLELARAETLARAARRLRVDYTTVGRRVSAFERELGAKLFERTPDGFVLTDAGESIRAAAEQMEQSAVDVEQRALGADRRLSGTVRVAAAESAGHAVVLAAMRDLHQRHPEIRLHLQTGLARLDIARREADLALRFAPPESGDLRIRRLTSMGFALYASEDYLARHRPPAPGAGFAGHDAVLFEEGFRGAPAFASLTDSLRDARAAVRANSMLPRVQAVATGLGVGALTCCLGDADPRLRRGFPHHPAQGVHLCVGVPVCAPRPWRLPPLFAPRGARWTAPS